MLFGLFAFSYLTFSAYCLLLAAFCFLSAFSAVHPVTAGRCAEKGKKLIDNYEGVWGILEERS